MPMPMTGSSTVPSTATSTFDEQSSPGSIVEQCADRPSSTDRGHLAAAGRRGRSLGLSISRCCSMSSCRITSKSARRCRSASTGSPSTCDLAVLQHDRPVAEVGDLVEAVGDQHDGAALVLELPDPVHALALERLVTDGQHLVDQQDVRVDVHGDGERQPHVHAGRVELHLGVDERLDAGEGDDRVEELVGLLAATARGSTR